MTVVAQRRVRARRGEGDRLREEILTATEALLVETGNEDAVSVRAVAKRVGVTTPAIYLHFADKAELIDAVCSKVFAEIGVAMDAAAEGVDDPFEGLRLRGMAYVQFGLDNPEHYRVLMMRRPAADPTGGADMIAASAAFEQMLDAVRACVEAGVFRGEPMSLALGLWAAAHGCVSLLISKPGFPWPPVEQFVDATIRMAGLGTALMSRLPEPHPDRGSDGLAALLDAFVQRLA